MKATNHRSRFFFLIACLALLLNIGGGALSLAWADPGTWADAGSMINSREYHTATRLQDGKVLFTGPFSLTELYDPSTGTFAATGPMSTDRFAARATLLPDGKVLITGGSLPVPTLATQASAEIYDPSTGIFSPTTGPMNAAREFHTATLLQDGTVLIVGGYDNNNANSPVLNTAELYDPSTKSFTLLTYTMSKARFGHTATLLPNGDVLIAGGLNTFDIFHDVLDQAELYDPQTKNFHLIRSGGMIEARTDHTATLLPNGIDVLIAGGQGNGGNYLNSAELYDISRGTTTRVDPMTVSRSTHTATLLPDGKVLIAGGQDGSHVFRSAELFDPATLTFTATGSMAGDRIWHTATLLSDGRVLVAGGFGRRSDGSNGILASAELYCPDSGVFNPTGSLETARTGHTATPLHDGTVLIAGGYDSVHGKYLNTAELYNPVTGLYTTINSVMPRTRAHHTATLLHDGRVLLIGGDNEQYPSSLGSALASADIYDPVTKTFSYAGRQMDARYGHTATLLRGGSVLIIGGNGNDPPTIERFINGGFKYVAHLQTKRDGHTATLFRDENGYEQVLIAGGSEHLAAEVYPIGGASTNYISNPMKQIRFNHTATLLPDGKVLIAGGDNAASNVVYRVSVVEPAEIFNPASMSFTSTSNMGTARSSHTATLLPNGKVLIIGGERHFSSSSDGVTTYHTEQLSSAEIYDPTSGVFSYAGDLETVRSGHTATYLTNYKVLIVGGEGRETGLSLNTSELYKTTVCGPEVCGPHILAISSTSGQTGPAVTITGSNFGASQGSSTVAFDGNDAGTATTWSDTEITVNAPSGVSTGSVIVTVNGFPSNAMAFSISSCATNVSGRVSTARGGFRINRTTHRYVQQVTLTNTSNAAIAGPVSLALDNLTSNATLFNKSGDTSCATPISSYITVNVGADNVLSAGENSSVVLEFVNPTNSAIDYTTRILTGTNK